jgi:integrase
MYIETIKSINSISYRTSININGKNLKSPVFKRKTDCKSWFTKKSNEVSQFKLHGDLTRFYQKITIDEYSIQWLRTKEAQGVSRSTMQNYKRYIDVHILPFLNGLDLKKVQKNHIEAMQIHLKKKHNPKGINLIIGALKSMFREAILEGYLIKSPCEHIKTISSDSAHEVFWTKSEIDQFLKANYENELYNFFIIALNSGMRKGELAGLCWDRVDFIQNTITVTRTRDKYELKERTKTKMKRVIPMNELTKSVLLQLFKARGSDQKLVFLKKSGEPINPHHIYRSFHEAQDDAKMQNHIRFHDVRHTFASQFVINGGSIYDLQKILGHTNVQMTMRYAHLSMEHLQNVMKGFNLGGSCHEQAPIKELQESVVYLRDFSKADEFTQKSPKTDIEDSIFLNLQREV